MQKISREFACIVGRYFRSLQKGLHRGQCGGRNVGVGVHSSGKGKKNGVPPYTNLVNLKSNTMKNTLQRYDKFHFLQIIYIKNGVKNTFS